MARENPPAPEGVASFRPFIPASASPRELTGRALVVGTLLGLVFGASSLYLVLKVGLTVSASIPVAVISLALFRTWAKVFHGRDATILENTTVQTAGSAGESIAFGIGVTMPAILILGFDLEIARVMLVGLLGGLLGILMMIPLRRALMVAEHGKLKYPEGTACAEVLKAGADEESRQLSEQIPAPPRPSWSSSSSAIPTGPGKQVAAAVRPSGATIFAGFGLALAYKTAMSAFRLWKDAPEKTFGVPLKGGSVSIEVSPELLGVGYIIGPRIASIMMAGGALGFLVLIPLIKFFGDGLTVPLAPGQKLISEMGPGEIQRTYLMYIGAGAVAAGGIISLFRSLPTIVRSLRSGLADLRHASGGRASVLRTERDLSMKFVGAGLVVLVLAILVAPTLHMNVAGAVLIVIFGFLFVTVSSRLTGEIGSSSNPISGMTVATLLVTCLFFLLKGWTGPAYFVTALSVGAVVCIAASNGGTTSQDLKTGHLVGATPKYQQIAILIGTAISALVLGPILLGLNESATVYVPAAKVAPGLQAPAELKLERTETLPTSQFKDNTNTFRVWHKHDLNGAPPGKYLVDDSGAAIWLVDPGINGSHTMREDGVEVRKFDAPKARLMSELIRGILGGQMPWTLVILGILISVVLELCGIPSLAFAVGVYIPLSSSAPIFAGGTVRWLVDRRVRHQLRHQKLEEHELVAETDKSPGVLLASGYIAGGAIAGIVIAFLAGALPGIDSEIANWAKASNPLFAGMYSDLLSLLPFAVLTVVLYLVGHGWLLKGKARS